MELLAVRGAVVLLLLVLLGVALRRRERVLAFFQRFWLEPSSPVNVAVLRIIVFGMITRSAFGTNALWYAGLPVSERDMPWGWGWLGADIFDVDLVAAARIGLIVSGAAATLGIFSRASAPVAALLAVYIFGIPNFFAKINHGGHLRMLCALAIAFAPCGDALSVDRLLKWLRGVAAPSSSAVYTIPVRTVWLMVGTSYFFPGLWKLWESGDLWISGRQLLYELRAKWAGMPHFEPLYRIDLHDWLLALLGAATLVFEIGFVFALLNRTTRTIAALSAPLFHLGIAQFMGIRFPAFFPLIVLVEIPERWAAIRHRVPAAWLSAARHVEDRALAWAHSRIARFARSMPGVFPVRSVRPVAVAAALLIGAQSAAGFTALNSWPISVFPTFSRRAKKPPSVGSTMLIKLESKGAKPVNLESKLARVGSTRLRRLLRGIDERDDGRSLVALFRHSRIEIEPTDRVVIYRATWKVIPPGKRKGYRERVTARYRVTKEGTLIPAHDDTSERPSQQRPRE